MILEKFKQASKSRHDYIDDAIDKFFRKVRGSQSRLNREAIDKFLDLLDTENGRIRTTARNRQRVNTSKFWESFIDKEGVSLLDNFLGRILKVLGLNKAYFSLFSNRIDAIDKRATKAIMDSYGYDGKKYVQGGILHSLISDITIERQIKNIAIAAINQGATLASFRKSMKEYIIGDDERLGAWEKHFYTHTYDAFQEVDREVSDIYRKDIKLRHAVYQGGKVKGTRSFCLSRDGKAYTEEEILEWQQLNWQGKKRPHFILRDAGGYNCRHTYDWISEELYEILKDQEG